MRSQCFENEYGKIHLGILITGFAWATKFQGLNLSNNETNILVMHVKIACILHPKRSQQSNHDQSTIMNYLLKQEIKTREMHYVYMFHNGKLTHFCSGTD